MRGGQKERMNSEVNGKSEVNVNGEDEENRKKKSERNVVDGSEVDGKN